MVTTMAALPHLSEEPYSSAGHFARAVGGGGWKSVRLAMFTAYFDASGSEDQSALAVAGFIASAEAWIEWESAWLKRLAADGLKRFHYKQLAHWEKARRAALITDLCAVIREHVSYKTGVVVVVAQTLDIFSTEERKKWGINPYTLACWNAARVMKMWAQSWGGPFPELFFEKEDPGQKWLDRYFKVVGYPRPNIKRKTDYTNRKSGIQEIGLVPFDAADLFAHELFSRVRNDRRAGSIRAPPRGGQESAGSSEERVSQSITAHSSPSPSSPPCSYHVLVRDAHFSSKWRRRTSI